MAGQAPIVMVGTNFLESAGVVSNVATNKASRDLIEKSLNPDGRELYPAGVSTEYVEAKTVRVLGALVGEGDVPAAHIDAAETSHSITDFATANSAANAIGVKLNAVLVALENVHIVTSV